MFINICNSWRRNSLSLRIKWSTILAYTVQITLSVITWVTVWFDLQIVISTWGWLLILMEILVICRFTEFTFQFLSIFFNNITLCVYIFGGLLWWYRCRVAWGIDLFLLCKWIRNLNSSLSRCEKRWTKLLLCWLFSRSLFNFFIVITL